MFLIQINNVFDFWIYNRNELKLNPSSKILIISICMVKCNSCCNLWLILPTIFLNKNKKTLLKT